MSFKNEFEKTSSNAARMLGHAGLATLAAPSVATLASSKSDKKEKIKSGAEVAGLGLLHGEIEAAHAGSPLARGIKKLAPKLAKGV